MQHSLTFDNGQSRAWNGSGHGLGFWLLIGATALGLLLIVAPYCHGLIAKGAGGTPAAMQSIADAARLPAECIASSSCRSAAVAWFVRVDSGSVPDRADLPDPIAAPTAVPLRRRSTTEFSYFLTDPPPLGTPLYLRHQRFLI